jgi:hypothetical protein
MMSSPDGRCRVVELDLVEFSSIESGCCVCVRERVQGKLVRLSRFERPVWGCRVIWLP